MADAGHALTLR